jgi:hypothetical protein
MPNRNQRTTNAILTRRITNAGRTSLAIPQVGKLARLATQKEVLQTGIALVEFASTNSITREQEMELTRNFMGLIKKSEVPNIIACLPDCLRTELQNIQG